MTGNTTTSIWEDFGVDTVITPDENAQSAHEQEMLALNVSARSGDDSFDLVKGEEEEEEHSSTDSEGLSKALEGDEQSDPLGEQNDDSIRINTETGEVDDDAETGEDADAAEDGQGANYEIPSESEELTGSVTTLREHTEGFNAMVDKALSEGDVDQETYERVQEEYLSDEGLSEDSYKTLEEKGYSRQYVNAFIQGQEALTNAYANELINYVGGQENFTATYEWLEANNPALKDMLTHSMENLETTNVKAIFDSVKAQRVQRFGKAPQRNLASRSQPQRPQVKQARSEGYTSMGEMMEAMSDTRYRNDEAFRADVERRVAAM